MRATKVLQKCLGDALQPMHALRRHVLLRAVEALIQGRRLTLIDVARAWPGAERIRAPLKALDRPASGSGLVLPHATSSDATYRRIVQAECPPITFKV